MIPSVLGFAGVEIEPVESDPELLAHLLRSPQNCEMLGASLTSTTMASAFFERTSSELWSSVTRIRAARLRGLILNADTDPSSLNTRVICLAEGDLDGVAFAISLFARHLFWSFPLHRLYTYLPASAVEVAEGFAGAGFQTEGRLVEHALLAGHPEDVTVLGLLRRDFDAWATANAGALALKDGA